VPLQSERNANGNTHGKGKATAADGGRCVRREKSRYLVALGMTSIEVACQARVAGEGSQTEVCATKNQN
jgi:hypothetical protein